MKITKPQTFGEENLYNKYGLHLILHNDVFTQIHNHTYYEFHIQIKGSIKQHFNTGEELLKKGDIIMIAPSFTHFYSDKTHDMEFLNLAISKTVFRAIVNGIDIPFIKTFIEEDKSIMKFHANTENLNKLINLYKKIDSNKDKTSYSYSLDLKFFFVSILEIICNTTQNSQSTLPKWLKEFLDKLDSPDNYLLRIEELSKYVPYTHNYLCFLFKKNMGTTLSEFFIAKKIDYAAYLLKTTNDSIYEISSRVGYDTQGHFSVLFKKRYKISPLKYRQNNTK